MYALIVTFVLSGTVHEAQWRSYARFEECWEAATIIVRGRPDIVARCVLIEDKQ
jgi:hypothetical protein